MSTLLSTTNRLKATLLTVLVLLLLEAVAFGAPGPIPNLADDECPLAAFRKADPRLEQKVTVHHLRVRVGELLEEVAKFTSVDISADEKDGAADPCVATFATDVTTADLLEAIWSLYSYRHATWRWTRIGSAPNYAYKLERPRPARNLPATIDAIAQADFEAMFKEAKDLLEGRRTNPHSDIVPGLSILDSEDRGRIPISLFFNVLTKQQQQAVLRNDAVIHITTSQLPAEARKWVHDEWQFGSPCTIKPTGERIPKPESSFIEIDAQVLPGTEARSYAVVIEHIGGLTWIGGGPLKRIEQAKIADLWHLPGDLTTSLSDQIPLARPPYPDDPAMVDLLNTLPRRSHGTGQTEIRLWQLSQVTGIPVLARMPTTQSFDPVITPGVTIGEYLVKAFEGHGCPYAQFKWRNRFLLATYSAWFRDVEQVDPPPWSLVKWLRAEEARNNNWLPLSVLCHVARDYPKTQIQQLRREFDGPYDISLRQTVFAAIGRSTKLCRTLDNDHRVDLRIDPALLDPALITPAIAEKLAHRIRCHAIVTYEDHTDKPIDPQVLVRVLIELEDGTQIDDFRTYYYPRGANQSPPIEG